MKGHVQPPGVTRALHIRRQRVYLSRGIIARRRHRRGSGVRSANGHHLANGAIRRKRGD